MATRMTKLQVEYIRKKLIGKISELVEKKLSVMTMGDSYDQVLKDVGEKAYMKWLFKQSKTRIVMAFKDDGLEVVHNIKSYHAPKDLRALSLAFSYTEPLNAFFISSKAGERWAKIDVAEERAGAYRRNLEASMEATMDKVVLSGSAEDVTKAIDAFMAQKA